MNKAQEDEIKELAEIDQFKQLSVLYWNETYGGTFTGHVQLEDLPAFAKYVINKLSYTKRKIDTEKLTLISRAEAIGWYKERGYSLNSLFEPEPCFQAQLAHTKKELEEME